MKIVGVATYIDLKHRTVTVDSPILSVVSGDMLFAAEPGEHIAYRRVPTGGWHFTWVQIALLAIILVSVGFAAGVVLYG